MIAYKLNGFEYENVELLDSPFLKQRDYTIALYLNHPSNNDILHGVRKLSGIKTEAHGMPGWGPCVGQYFGAYAKLYRATCDRRIYDKCIDLFDGWTECADICEKVLDQGTYMYEKLIGGLLDMYEYMDVKRTRVYVWRLTEHAKAKFDTNIPRDGLQDHRMKGQIEWYTLPENLYRAYQLFGDTLYKEFAEIWLYDYMWDKAAADDFQIGPRHAYSHVNCLSSAARAYIVTEDEKYLAVIEKAYREILAHHTYATGGYGPAETLFGEGDGFLGDMLKSNWDFPGGKGITYTNFAGGTVARSDTWGSCEVSCCAWAVFKLCNYLLKLTGNARYGDWAEKMLVNGTLGQLPITENGKVMYYASYFVNGAVKSVDDRRLTDGGGNNVWQCCTGTFPQDVAEYANMIYYRDDNGLYVSQYIPSLVEFEHMGHKIALKSTANFPKEQRAIFTVHTGEPVPFSLKLRVPSWAANDACVYVNDSRQDISVIPDTWLSLEREWSDGDTVRLELPYVLAFQSVDRVNQNIVALTYGPLALACDEMTILVGDREHPENWLKPVEGAFATFETLPGHSGKYEFILRRFRPYYQIGPMEWYYMYNRIYPDMASVPHLPWL
jgi:uncharacterized protein